MQHKPFGLTIPTCVRTADRRVPDNERRNGEQSMKPPKILPWIARQAGVPEARAEELWAEAIRHATERTAWVGTSDYWKAALGRWMVLIEDKIPVAVKESSQGSPPTPERQPFSLIAQ